MLPSPFPRPPPLPAHQLPSPSPSTFERNFLTSPASPLPLPFAPPLPPYLQARQCLREGGALPILPLAMRAHHSSPSLLALGFTVLRRVLMADLPSIKASIDGGLPLLLLSAMETHPSSAEVHAASGALIKSLAWGKRTPPELQRLGAVNLLVSSMQSFPRNAQV